MFFLFSPYRIQKLKILKKKLMTKIRNRKMMCLFKERGLFVCFLLLSKTGLDLKAGSGKAGEGNQLTFRPENKEWRNLILEVHLA